MQKRQTSSLLSKAAEEIERLRHYPEAIELLKQHQFTDQRICEDIERMVKDAIERDGPVRIPAEWARRRLTVSSFICQKCGDEIYIRRSDEINATLCRPCLEAEVERLRQEVQDQQDDNETMRSVVLNDPDHDSDTINWVLGLIDHYCKYPEAALAAEELE